MIPSSKIQEFVELVDQRFDRDRPESFWEVEDVFHELVSDACVVQLMNAELERLLANPCYTGEWRPNQLVVHQGRAFALSVWLFESARQYVHSTPFFAMYAPVGSLPLNFTRYELPADYRNEVFNPGNQIHSPSRGQVARGEVLKLQSDRYVYDFQIEKPVVVVKLTTSPFHAMEWLFNKETGYAWQANDSETKATQLRVAAFVLGKLADPSSVEPLKQLTVHPHHAVRWAAVQSLGRINRSAAVEKLQQSLSDPHPHVRRAAAKALAQLKEI
jgi:hypothetical protein